MLLIDEKLRVIIQQLEESLNIGFDAVAVNKVFEDEALGLASAKFYTLFKHSRGLFPDWSIEGIVDEHEPAGNRIDSEPRRIYQADSF